MSQPIVIIGTGLAGYQLAREFRKINQATPLTLISADDGRYYPKPELSTALTQGKSSDALATATAEKMATQLDATIHTHAHVSAIDPIHRLVFINDKTISYEKLILACGADVIQPQLKGDAAQEVLSINHIYHYTAFQERIKNKKTIAILGAGLIGCEFANDLSNAHYKVHIITLAKAPLDLLVPEKIGKILQKALEKNGVHFHFQCTANRVNKMETGYCLELSNGNELEADFILSAIGLKPHINLATTAGIQTNRGILVNRYLETSTKDIYALGDCAEVEGHVLPYIAPILNCSRALAKTLCGNRTPVEYPAMPIIVKTPAHPIVVCPPPKNMPGKWEIETLNESTRALFYNQQHQLYGFILTNETVKERSILVKQMPTLF
ncbi:MAG: rubredoxin-NAD(+) reductase [Gammaproteobacteria bacterium]|jgi:rubredoxin-NAD+ reductase|nr:rubredoxin-NAD(+) reductase [Gammaproteobacteria bacterium]